MDDLALEVREVDLVVVDDAERADAGRGEVQRDGGSQAACAQQQDLGVEQLLLALEPDLGDEQVARVAVALLGRKRTRDLDLVAAVLPKRDAAGHVSDVRESELLGQRVRRERGAVAGLAVEDDRTVTVRADGAFDPCLEVAARDVHGARDVARGELLVLAHVHEDDAPPVAVRGQLGQHVARIDLANLGLDLALELLA